MLLLVGKSCTGKTTILNKLIHDGNGYIGFEASTIASQIQSEKGHNDIFKRYGKDVVARYIKKQCDNIASNVIISGLRTEEEIDYLKQYYQIYIVSLYISDKESYMRNLKRKREKFASFEDFFLNKLCYDYSIGLANLYRRSNLFIQEDGLTIDEIYIMILSSYHKYVIK